MRQRDLIFYEFLAEYWRCDCLTAERRVQQKSHSVPAPALALRCLVPQDFVVGIGLDLDQLSMSRRRTRR